MADATKDPKIIGAMFSAIAPYYNFLNELLSFKQAGKWRKILIKSADLPRKGLILDLCTGSGELALGFLTERPDFAGYVIGIDFSAIMIDNARAGVAKLGAPYPRRVEFLMGDALDLPYRDDKFDLISVGFGIRNLADTEAGIKELHRVLKPGREVNILEFFRDGIVFEPVRWYVDYIVPLIGNVISRTNAYSYLRDSARNFYTIGEFDELLKKTGFTDIRWEPMTFGIAQLIRARKGQEG
jgi:demethylmenaquinone methyltransferase / 2-methoxy-6-polyprenyl-1,4-benzoquinol methylase